MWVKSDVLDTKDSGDFMHYAIARRSDVLDTKDSGDIVNRAIVRRWDTQDVGDCIKLVHGESCICKRGNCENGKPDIRKWLRGKCGVAVKSHKDTCDPAVKCQNEDGACDCLSCGPSFSKKMMSSGSYGLSWQYNWGNCPAPWNYPSNMKYAPQFWGAKTYKFPQLKLDGDYQPTQENFVLPILLGFNEPDLNGLGSHPMSVEKAVRFWKKNVISGIKKGYRQFVSPAMALPLPRKYNLRPHDLDSATDWLPHFLDRLAKESRHHKNININGKTFSVEIDWKSTVDYLAVHKYEPNCQISADSFKEWNVDLTIGSAKRLMDDYNNRRGFNIKGIWLTEFAGAKGASCKSLTQQRALLEKWVQYLLNDDKVVAMAWFSYDGEHSPYYDSNANLWNYDTKKPNELGKKYFDLCSEHRY